MQKLYETNEENVLAAVVLGVVDHPDAAHIARETDDMGVLLTLDLHPDDMGKIIGKAGATAKAIRTVLRVVGMRNKARVNLKINEPEGSTHVAAPKHSLEEALEGVQ